MEAVSIKINPNLPTPPPSGKPESLMTAGDRPYREIMTRWEAEAALKKPRPRYEPVAGTLAYSPELEPLLLHDQVPDRGEVAAEALLIHKSLKFIDFTTHIELRVVNPICAMIACNVAPFAVPRALAFDAGKMITDEGDHASRGEQLGYDLARAHGIEPARRTVPRFLKKLRASLRDLDRRRQKLAEIQFTVTSETLVSSTLTKVPADPRVNPSIRVLLLDHARDERFHAGVCAQLMGIAWEALSRGDRDRLGPLYAVYLDAFLAPDPTAQRASLEAVGYSVREARRIVLDTAAMADKTLLARAAAPTLGLLQRCGILDHPATHDALAAAGLVQ